MIKTTTMPSLGHMARSLALVFIWCLTLLAGSASALTATTNTLTLTAASVSVGQATTLTATISPSAATGTVTFKDGTATLGVATISAGVAKLSTSFTTVGTHSITAIYAGNSTYATSTAAAKTQTVTSIATTNVLTLTSASVTVGQATTLTATVTPSSATGTVTFKDGTTTLGVATLSAGVAKLSTTFTTIGSHSLTAIYAGSPTHAAKTSTAKSQTVTAISTSTGLTANPTSTYVGQTVTLNATVSPSAATGTVTFKDGTTTLGSVKLTSGTASLSKKFTTAGTHALTAVYAANGNYAASTSATVNEVVTAVTATTTTLTASTTTAYVGQPIVLTAKVNQTAATGTITFKDGTTTIGTGTLSGGVATLNASFSTAGTHSLTAVYSGAPTYSASTSAALSATIKALTATTTTLASSTTTVSVGQYVTLTATVSPTAATGTVTFKDGATSIGTGNVVSGKATLYTAISTGGAHSMTAVYNGSSSYNISTSAAVTITATAPTLISLSSSSLSPTAGQAVTLTATVSPAAATGNVTFKDGTTVLGTSALSAGVAILKPSFSTAGTHALTAVYAGNTTYRTSTSPVLSVSVNGAAGPIPAPPASPVPVTSFNYDAQGNPIAVTLAPSVAGYSFTTSTNYDALNRAKTITDAASGNTQLSYDGRDRVTAVTDPKTLTTQYNRDGLGQTTQLVSPDTGTSGMTYDAAGNLLTRTDSRGVLAQHSYDSLDRLTSTVLSQSGQANQTYGWTYDQTGGMFTNGIGRLTSITFPEGSSSYAYDAQGRVTQARQILNPNASANPQVVVHYTAYAYDGAGNLTGLTYPSGRVLNITYANGLPTGMSLAGSTLISNLQFAPFGGPQSWNWATDNGVNGGSVPHARVYDTSGRLVRYPLGEHLRDVSYDAANRISGYTHYVAASGATTGSTAPAQNQQFAYDALSRLTQATTSQATWTYTYDANGNRTSVAINNGTANAYTVDPASNRLTNLATPAITLTHDAMGNIVSDGTYTMGYDLRGRLTTASQGGNVTTYAYDNGGQRVRKFKNSGTSSTVIFVYDQAGQLLGEYDSAGVAIREYVWLGNMPVAMFTPDPAQGANANMAAPLVYYIHADHLNTPRVLVDKTNTMRWRWMSEPFGTTAPDTSPAGLAALTFNLRFPGQFYDVESGMFYNYQRDYIPGIGRYAQSDPIGLAGGQASTFAYVGSNPLSYSDPLGLWASDAHDYFIDRMFPDLSPELRNIIKEGSGYADSPKYQGELYAGMHAMTSPKMNKEQARLQMCKFIKDNLARANLAKLQGDPRYLYLLGMALHPIMDYTSPAHRGWQTWHGSSDMHKHGPWPTSLENLSVAKQEKYTMETLALMKRALDGDLSGCECE